jgi:hypothetical protein
MPELLLKRALNYGANDTLWLVTPLPGRTLREVRNALALRGGVRVLWQGQLARVKEYQALHWVDVQHTIAGGGELGYRNYQVAQASGFEGYDSAVASLYSAVVAMLPKGADIGGAEVLVVRLFA